MDLTTNLLLFILIICLSIASWWDFKIKEVPDWMNFFLIIVGLGVRLIMSLWYVNHVYILEGIIGFGLFGIVSMLMYYAGQWGGGDAKLLMGIGAIIGLLFNKDHIGVKFVMFMLVIAALYGIIWIFYIAYANRGKIKIEMLKWKLIFLGISDILMIFIIIYSYYLDGLIKYGIMAMAGFLILFSFILILAKPVEKSLLKRISVDRLREGDWVISDKYKCGNEGVTKKDMEKMKRMKIKFVIVKEGMPFTPVFLFTYILVLII